MSRSLLRLYREILKTAAVFPSKNRASIITEIKSEFRAARGETDAAVIEKKILLAKDGLDRMRVFTGLDGSAQKWDVSMKGPFDGTTTLKPK